MIISIIINAFVVFIGMPLLLFFLIIVPEIIAADINKGIELMFKFRVIEGFFILTRPIWGTIFLVACFWALGNSEMLVDKLLGRK